MRWLALSLTAFTLMCCKPTEPMEPVTMVIGSWYGFYPFYFAVENGIDEKHGIKLKIVEPDSIANFRRGYLRSQVDLSATSMLEYTNATQLSGLDIRPIIITDYSNGGDNIIATKDITHVDQLKGKRIAVPSKGIAEYLMSVVLDDQTPTDQFQQIPIPEHECMEAFVQGKIDACVTYPPISTYLLENTNLHVVYTSKQHPQRIFDLAWAKPHVSRKTVEKTQLIWFDVIDLINRDKDSFYQFVASISNVDVSEVKQSMQGIQLIDSEKFKTLRASKSRLTQDLVTACKVAKNDNCNRLGQRLWDYQ